MERKCIDRDRGAYGNSPDAAAGTSTYVYQPPSMLPGEILVALPSTPPTSLTDVVLCCFWLLSQDTRVVREPQEAPRRAIETEHDDFDSYYELLGEFDKWYSSR